MRRSASLAALVAVILATPALTACTGRDPVAALSTTARTSGPGTSDTLRLVAGQRGTVDDGRLTIEFVAISSDSRCPSTAICAWAGEAVAELHLTADARRTAATLRTALAPRPVTFGGYDVALVHVAPYPDGHERIPPAAYVAVLEVTRK